jgi:DNA-directed RNA polymerase beta' subunit
MSRPLRELWLDVLRPPPGFTLWATALARVDDEALRLRAPCEVTRPETLNFRTFKPKPDGLFCDVIFGEGPIERGPFADDEPVTEPRATRFGRIELPAPIVHPLALAHAADEVAARARISRDELDELTTYADPTTWRHLGERLADTEDGAPLLLHAIPVLPPYLRPIRRLGEDGWVSADLNDLYRRVINRGFRLRRLLELAAPDVIVANEHKFMAQAIHMLFENEDCPAPATDPKGRPQVSLRTLAVGNRLFEALTALDRGHALPDEGPLPRTLHHPIAALYAMGLELRRC